MFALGFSQQLPGPGLLQNAFPIVLGQGRKDLQDELSGRCHGIHAQVKGFEVDAPLLKASQQLDQVITASAQAEEASYHDSISFSKLREQLVEGRAGRGRAGDFVVEDFIAASPAKGIELGVEVLLERGDAGVAEELVHGASESRVHKGRPRFVSGPTC